MVVSGVAALDNSSDRSKRRQQAGRKGDIKTGYASWTIIRRDPHHGALQLHHADGE